MPLRRLAVVSGSDPIARAEHHAAATELGRLLAEQNITLMYDGSARGPIGALVAALSEGHGLALCVEPQELGEGSDGILVLPGGPEGLEELLERCLAPDAGSDKACGFLNTVDYFSGLLKTVSDGAVERFVRESQRGRLIVHRDPAELLRAMADFRPPETRRQSA